jgi:hypothetical protein
MIENADRRWKDCLKNMTFVFLFILYSVFFPNFILSSEQSNYSLEEAKKVLRLIEKIQVEQLDKGKNDLRKVTVTESELNSYIAYRIETEKEEIMKELRLKLFKENKIEGKILIDLRGQKLPKLLRPQMNLYFGAKVEVKEGNVRIAIKELFLEEQPIQPMVLDLIIYISAKLDGVEPTSMNDWYELPYGIKNIETFRGKAIFYY